MYTFSREIPVTGEYDVIVAGSGPAGMCAAVSAARRGAKTALIERYGQVGGNLTTGHVGPSMGAVSAGTMREEVRAVLNIQGTDHQHDVEEAKAALTAWICGEAIDLYLQSPVADVIREGNAVRGVVAAGKSGLFALRGKVIVDATGDGSAACFAGAEYAVGRAGDGLCQPATLMFTVAGISPEQTLLCRHEEEDTRLPAGSYLVLCEKAREAGELPPNVSIVRLYQTVRKCERMVNATQANGIDGVNVFDITRAEADLRAQTRQVHEFLKKYVPGFEESYIKDSADTTGIRETRRVTGEYVLRGEDLLCGRKFPDVMVHNAEFAIDIHNPDGAGQAETDGRPHTVQPYDIPYRCFVPLKIENLLTAGRCISGSHRAHASYRVMDICMAAGQAVGVAAALCAEQNRSPRALDFRLAQKCLTDLGVNLFA
jgi:glycine/D-amino acid oxidase-like deaminating enzyme